MKTRVLKLDDGLALRIPKEVAAEAGFQQDESVDISFENGKLTVTSIDENLPTLADILKRITPLNNHSEFQTGPSTGKERW